MYALVWGRSTKHSPQTCGLEHQLTDEDVIQVLKKSGKGSGFGKAQQATSGRIQKSWFKCHFVVAYNATVSTAFYYIEFLGFSIVFNRIQSYSTERNFAALYMLFVEGSFVEVSRQCKKYCVHLDRLLWFFTMPFALNQSSFSPRFLLSAPAPAPGATTGHMSEGHIEQRFTLAI
jgi:hypothetical protein